MNPLVASVTLTVTAAVVRIFTVARCPSCARKLMSIPAKVTVEAHPVKSDAESSGRGRVLSCKRCGTLAEVIEHNV